MEDVETWALGSFGNGQVTGLEDVALLLGAVFVTHLLVAVSTLKSFEN